MLIPGNVVYNGNLICGVQREVLTQLQLKRTLNTILHV